MPSSSLTLFSSTSVPWLVVDTSFPLFVIFPALFHNQALLHCCQVQSLYKVTICHPFLFVANEPSVYVYKQYNEQRGQHMSTHTYIWTNAPQVGHLN